MKNILMIAYTTYTTDARVIKEAESMIHFKYNVDFICLRRENELKFENVKGVNVFRLNQLKYRGENSIRYIASYFEFLFRSFFKILSLWKKKKYCIIHINNMPDFLVLSAVLFKLLGAKIILDIHDPMPNLYNAKMNGNKSKLVHKILLAQEVISARMSDSVITVSDPVKESLVKDGIPESKINVVANFADENLYELSNGYAINQKITMIYHGTIAERYGMKNILSALSKIDNRENFYFKIIGEGDYSANIYRMIEEYNLKDFVEFDNQYYPVKKVGNIIKDFNLGIVCLTPSPATDYALSTKMVEYLAIGIPVLTIENTAAKYYCGKAGCLFYNPDNEADTIKIFNSISNDRQILIRKHREVMEIRDKFRWINERDKYHNVILKLIDRQIKGKDTPKVEETVQVIRHKQTSQTFHNNYSDECVCTEMWQGYKQSLAPKK